MLMRVFLLLLAMMTGLSAAQAEERLRPVRGYGAVQAARLVSQAEQHDVAAVAGHRHLLPADISAAPRCLRTSTCFSVIPPVLTVQKSDRLRQ